MATVSLCKTVEFYRKQLDLSAISEIFVMHQLVSILGAENVHYEPGKKNERKSDFRVKSRGRLYNLELKTLMKSTSTKKIESIFDSACLNILNLVNDKRIKSDIILSLDTTKLCVNNEGQIDEERSKNYILSNFDKLELLSLIGNDIKIDFDSFRSIDFENIGKDRLCDIIVSFHNNNTGIKKIVHSWLEKIEPKELALCPFASFETIKNTDNSCVSLIPLDFDVGHSKSIIPGTLAAELSKKSYIDQINKALEKKHGQIRESQIPSIVILDTYDWHFDYFEYESFLLLKKLIEVELNKFPKISGVILFNNIKIGNEDHSFYDGRYIENKSCRPTIRVGIEELGSLGIIKTDYANDPKIVDDLIISANDNLELQLLKINSMIKIQSSIILDSDKIRLLQCVYTLLDNTCLDKQILEQINMIVYEYCFDPNPEGTELHFTAEDHYTVVGMWYETVRSSAVSCLFKLLPRLNNNTNMILATTMAKDKHTLVREAVCRNLIFLYEINNYEGILIAKQLINDNLRVRFRLACHFIRSVYYLCTSDKEICLRLGKEIVEKQNSKLIERDETLSCIIEIICHGSLISKIKYYDEYLNDLISNTRYNGYIKENIAHYCSQKVFLSDKKLIQRILDIFDDLLLNAPDENKPRIAFFLLYNLRTNRIPFIPRLKKTLNRISKMDLDVTPSNLDFEILSYLREYWKEMHEEASLYTINVFENNRIDNLINVSYDMIPLIGNLLEYSIMPISLRSKLIAIVYSFFNRSDPYARQLLNKWTKT